METKTAVELELHIGAHTECRDGPGGTLRQVVLSRTTETVTHLIVDTSPYLGIAVLVPRATVASADHDRVRLTCTQAELHRMDPFAGTVFLPPDGQHLTLGYPASDYLYAGGPIGMMGMGAMGLGTMGWGSMPPAVVEEHLPAGSAAIGPDAVIETVDGDLGRVDEILTDPSSGVLTHLVVRRGHLFGAHLLMVPASAIAEVTDERVRLRYTRGELEAALRPPADHSAAGASVVATFDTRQQAEAALAALSADGFPNAALSAVTPQGQAVRFPSESPDRQAESGRHIAIGATLAGVPDVVLFGHLLIQSSVTTGGIVGILRSLGAQDDEAQHLTERLRAGQFLVAVHTTGDETGAQAVLARVAASEVHCLRP